jgi:hypothetical protein
MGDMYAKFDDNEFIRRGAKGLADWRLLKRREGILAL